MWGSWKLIGEETLVKCNGLKRELAQINSQGTKMVENEKDLGIFQESKFLSSPVSDTYQLSGFSLLYSEVDAHSLQLLNKA